MTRSAPAPERAPGEQQKRPALTARTLTGRISGSRTSRSADTSASAAGLEDDHILVCTSDAIAKAKDMRRDPRVALSLTDIANPYRMAAIQGRVVEIRSDEGCRYMDPISVKYTNAPFPSRGPDRVCFVIAVEKATQRTLSFVHNPGN